MSDAAPVALGIAGLGNMGLPMASRLVEAGYDVSGYDPSEEAARAAQARGIATAQSVGDLAAVCDRVILMLPNSDVVDAVAGDIAARESRRCTTIIDMSSSEPARTQALSETLRKHRIELIDAPVSGGVAGAKAGELTIMVGGDETTARELTPLLEVLGSRIVRVGPVGSGHAAKALNNLLSATHLLSSAEVIIAARKFGITPEALLSVVNASSGRSGSTQLKLPRYVLTGRFDSGFTADLLEKDIRIAERLAEQLGAELALGRTVVELWAQLNAELPRGADHTEIIRPLEQHAALEVRATAPGTEQPTVTG